MLDDVGPLGDQEEALRILGVAAEHAVLHLRRGLVHRVAVRIVELLEQPDEFVLAALLDDEVVDVKEVAFFRERFLGHLTIS